MSRPCSSHMYQEVLTSAKLATSSRRSPRDRLRFPREKPRSSGCSASRCDRKSAASSPRILSVCIISHHPLAITFSHMMRIRLTPFYTNFYTKYPDGTCTANAVGCLVFLNGCPEISTRCEELHHEDMATRR